MLRSQANIHLYNCADEAMQNAIVNTHPDFFTNVPDGMVGALVTQKPNLTQSYLIYLRATALDYDFTCPSCEHNLSGIYIKDKLIRGIANDALQADLLAKAGTHKSLEQNVCHTEAFESAL